MVKDSDTIIAIEARGFIFDSAIAFESAKQLIVARNQNKLPGKLIRKNLSRNMGILTI